MVGLEQAALQQQQQAAAAKEEEPRSFLMKRGAPWWRHVMTDQENGQENGQVNGGRFSLRWLYIPSLFQRCRIAASYPMFFVLKIDPFPWSPSFLGASTSQLQPAPRMSTCRKPTSKRSSRNPPPSEVSLDQVSGKDPVGFLVSVAIPLWMFKWDKTGG